MQSPASSMLTQLGRKHFVSERGLAAVLQELQEAGLLTEDLASSRSSIKRARDDEVTVVTAYGQLIRRLDIAIDDKTQSTFHYIHPAAGFRHACDVSAAFAQHVKQQHNITPSSPTSPWNIIYSDEVVTSDPLKHDARKLVAIYWTFKELGKSSLCNENHWFVLTVADSHRVHDLNGGMSELMKEVVLSFFQGEVDISVHGVSVPGCIIFAIVGIHCSDEAALKDVLQMKGHSGIVPCLKCPFTVRDTRMSRGSTDIVKHMCETDITKHYQYDDDELLDMIAHLKKTKAHHKTRQSQLENMCMAVGLNLVLPGILNCSLLRNVFFPISSLMYDWMHVYFVNGLWNKEAGLLLGVLYRHCKIRYTSIHEFMQNYTWPQHLSNSCKKVFETKAQVTQGPVSCTASDALSVYNVLRLFLMLRVMTDDSADMHDELRGACLCYMALCSVIDLLSSKVDVDANKLHDAIKLHCDMFIMVYGQDSWIPKHHFSLHLPSMLAHHGILVSLFTCERKHRAIKRYAPARFSEPNLMREVLSMQLRALDRSSSGVAYLVNPRPAPQNLTSLIIDTMNCIFSSIMTSRQACTGTGLHFYRNDVVVAKSGDDVYVGLVEFHVQTDNGSAWSCLRVFQRLTEPHTYEVLDSHLILPSDAVTNSCIYHKDGNVAYVLPPNGFS